MKQNTYEAPQMEIAEVEAEDIVRTSDETTIVRPGTQDLEL